MFTNSSIKGNKTWKLTICSGVTGGLSIKRTSDVTPFLLCYDAYSASGHVSRKQDIENETNN